MTIIRVRVNLMTTSSLIGLVGLLVGVGVVKEESMPNLLVRVQLGQSLEVVAAEVVPGAEILT